MRITAVALMTVLGGGCLSTSPQTVATGEPLEARAHEEHVDAYVNRRLEFVDEHDNFVFDGHFQGDQPIDELDFYHLAGDEQAAEGVAAWRRAHNRGMIATWVLSLASIGASLAGAAMFALSGDESPDDLSLGLMTGGGLGLGFGIAIVPSLFYPSEPLNDQGFVFDYDRARLAAERHNAIRTAGAE